MTYQHMKNKSGWRRAAASLLVCAGLSAAMGGCSTTHHQQEPKNFNAFMNGLLSKLDGGSGSNPKTPLKEAARMFDNATPDLQREAIAWLAKQPYGHDPAYLKAYQVAAEAPSPLVRGQAMLAMGTSRDPKVGPTLATGLGDKSAFVRMSAAMAAAEINNPVLISPLISAVRADPDSQVRIYAATALGYYNLRRVHRALISVLNNPNVALAQAAWQVLHNQTGQNLPMRSGPWHRWLESIHK